MWQLPFPLLLFRSLYPQESGETQWNQSLSPGLLRSELTSSCDILTFLIYKQQAGLEACLLSRYVLSL